MVANFYPRPPRGGRPRRAGYRGQHFAISIHALREEGDGMPLGVEPSQQISIHALREEGDPGRCGQIGETHISIHALREEGDPDSPRSTLTRKLFLSTPSARRATQHDGYTYRENNISIHALREEGDAGFDGVFRISVIFLSTPSARRATPSARTAQLWGGNFYPRPPRGGRRVLYVDAIRILEFLSTPSARRATVGAATVRLGIMPFLSTPSARRATAKTETKSLFSYKLYNILHEFRRALIYNGSKNYPNHAK